MNLKVLESLRVTPPTMLKEDEETALIRPFLSRFAPPPWADDVLLAGSKWYRKWNTKQQPVQGRRKKDEDEEQVKEAKPFSEMNLKEIIALIDSKLNESRNGRDYSSTQIAVSPLLRRQLLTYGKGLIADKDLAADGRELNPHITVKYGIHGNGTTEVRRLLKGEKPIKYTLGKISKFECADFDVVKVDIISHDLHRLNAKIKQGVETTDTHPTYSPHLTLAYVKKGYKLHEPLDHFAGMRGVANVVEFSSADDKITKIPLRS